MPSRLIASVRQGCLPYYLSGGSVPWYGWHRSAARDERILFYLIERYIHTADTCARVVCVPCQDQKIEEVGRNRVYIIYLCEDRFNNNETTQ